MVKIQQNDFNVGDEITKIRKQSRSVGAVVSFLGTVRDMNEGKEVFSMFLEHYPAMTQKSIEEITQQANQKWDIIDTLVIHRVGELQPTDQIVLVIVTSQHRQEAFAACEFIMDYLKTKAPFWKKEKSPNGSSHWVDARSSDQTAAQKWNTHE